MRIVFVVGATSIHTVRWIRQLEGTGWDIHIVDPENSPIHPELRGVTLHTGWAKEGGHPKGVRLATEWPFARGRFVLARRFPRIWNRILRDGPRRLAAKLQELRPDLIHSQATQYSAYPLIAARDLLGGSLPAPWIHSTWGSDLFLYGVDPAHRERLRRVMGALDFLMTDCERDVRMAREFAFKGEVLGVFPGGGGYPLEEMAEFRASGPPSGRRVIAVKGYQRPAGSALVALAALGRCHEALAGYEVVVHSSQPVVSEEVDRLAASGMNIRVVPRGPIEEIWRLLGASRIALGVSRSDGTPNAMLEAMILGALPVQTNPGGATAEWIEHGANGLLIERPEVEDVAREVRRAVEDNALVDAAAEANTELAQRRLQREEIRERVIQAYEHAARGAASGVEEL